MRQFAATVKKNAIEKRRNIRVTCCECFSHLVMFILLLLGLRLSRLVYFEPENYVKINILVPPSIFSNNAPVSTTPAATSMGNSRSLSAFSDQNKLSIGAILTGVKKQLKGPLPIPTFDQYITAAKFLTRTAANAQIPSFVLQTTLGEKYGNLIQLGELHFAPYPSRAVDSLVRHLNRTTTTFKTLTTHYHTTESAGVAYILNNLNKRAFALIVIRQITPQKINYVIRQNYTTLPNTNQVFISISRGLDHDFQMYLLSGFLTLERTVDDWALNYAVRQADPTASCRSPEVLTVPFPTYEFNSNPFYAQVGFLLGLAMTMSTLYPVSRLVKTVVEEKETRMREVMKIMGLSQFAHQLSWFFTAFVLFFWLAISSTFIAHVSFIPHTNPVILFVYFFLFHMSEITLSFLIGVFFSNSKLAAIVGPVVLFVAILPKYVFFGSNSNEAVTGKYAASLLSPTAFAFGADILSAYEYSTVGVQFSNINENSFSMISVFQMMAIDIFIYGFLAWYFDQTLSHEFGTPKSFFFIFNPFYWFPSLMKWELLRPLTIARPGLLPAEMNTYSISDGSYDNGSTASSQSDRIPAFQKTISNEPGVIQTQIQSQGSLYDYKTRSANSTHHLIGPAETNSNSNSNNNIPPNTLLRASSTQSLAIQTVEPYCGDIEVLSASLIDKVKVVASGLEKRYPNGKVAVKNFSMAMLEGQITCLLGHNGAGKSSVIAMITGLTTISAGDCMVYDHRLPGELSEIRTMTGMCPQQNVLFPTLTVREHLRFFGCIKGSYGKILFEQVDQMINDVGLSTKRDVPAGSLSGGMKRKLQLAMALIGGSKFLILDEPTSGMDPFSRRATWELLQKHKAGRVIVLTTHFLEEADILGDRIAIMSEGHVRTSGTSLFLKTRFGAGYLLSISISKAASSHVKKIHRGGGGVGGRNELEGGGGGGGGDILSPMTPRDPFNSPHDETESVEHVVKSFIPQAVCTSHVAGEMIFSLPIQSVPAFAALFDALRQKAEPLGVESYGVSLTSLEQVFIKLAKEKVQPLDLPEHSKLMTYILKAKDIMMRLSSPVTSQFFELFTLLSVVSSRSYRVSDIETTTSRVFPDGNGNGNGLRTSGGPEQKGTGTGTGTGGSVEKPLKNSKNMLNNSNSNSNRHSVYSDNNRDNNNSGGSDNDNDNSNDNISMTVLTKGLGLGLVPSNSLGTELTSLADGASDSKTYGYGYDDSYLNSYVEDRDRDREEREESKHSNSNTTTEGNTPSPLKHDNSPSPYVSPYEDLGPSGSGSLRERERVPMLPPLPPTPLSNDIDQSIDLRTPNPSSASWSIDISLHSVDSVSRTGVVRKNKLPETPTFIPAFVVEEEVSLRSDVVDVDAYLEPENGLEKLHTGAIHTQTLELLRKRYIIASRDLKGLFFQVVFPAIQILLILAILTININPAGRTIKMNASIFKFKPNTLVGGFTNQLSSTGNLSTSRLLINRYNANTSLEMSVDLLQSGNTLYEGEQALLKALPPSDHRLGAIIVKDVLDVTINVNWEWVKNNIGILIEAVFSYLGGDAGVIKSPETITIPARIIFGIINKPNTNQAQPQDRLKTFFRNVGKNARISNATVERLLNSSLYRDFNATKFYDQADSQSVTVHFDGASGDSSGLTLYNLTLSVQGNTFDAGDAKLSTDQIRNLLPNGNDEYVIPVPFPYTVMHNSTSPHGIAVFRGELIAATFQQCYEGLNITQQQRKLTPQSAYYAKNHPLPLTASQTLENRVLLSLLASLFILVPLCYIPASFITFVVRERMSKAKHLQLVSSVSPYLYWFATYVWDMVLFTALVLLIIGALFIYGKKAAQIFISVNEATIAVFLLLFTYGLSILPLCYIYSMFFDNHSTAQISIMAVNFATGFVAVLAYFVMSTIPTTQAAASQIVHFFRFFPPYNVGEGLIAITTAFFQNTLLGENISYFSFTVTGRNLIFMVAEAIGYFSIVLLTETPYYRGVVGWIERKRARLLLNQMKANNAVTSVSVSTDEEAVVTNFKDEDILYEEECVRNANKDEFALCIQNLVKIYPSGFIGGKAKHAVRGLTLGCQEGERLGFLGVNGAGKSTTLGVLTGDIAPTDGEVFIAGMPLSDPKTRLAIGYCPQTDPLFDLMTARETLWFYGRIRGIEKQALTRRVDKLIKQVGLFDFADRTSGTYSGGNKRKLSLAISLIGSPKVLLLDEPSSGMDPFARRQMWDVIAAVSEQRSVVLTTHSMEECEALCTRIGIMVDGSMRCLGPSSHLKARFANGYQVEVRFRSEDRFDEVMLMLKGICEDIEIDERHGQFLRLKVPALDLGYAFAVLEDSKQNSTGCVTDYTVCQNTLEQVFLKFAKLQEQKEGVEEHHADVIALGM